MIRRHIPRKNAASAVFIHGDACHIPLADESVDCVITSPPYYGLRDYGTGKWEGGDPDCDHKGPPKRTQAGFNERYFGEPFNTDKQGELTYPYQKVCGKCGAIRIDDQIGLEQSPDEYVDNLVGVFREVRRTLKKTGTVWIVIGDSYNGSGGAGGDYNAGGLRDGQPKYPGRNDRALKPKDLFGIPWRVAFALQADGWWLRDEIIWAKNNPMPSSVKDRTTTSHEHVFLLTKCATYYYDWFAVLEPLAGPIHKPGNNFYPEMVSGPNYRGGHSQWEDTKIRDWGNSSGRNRRSVWLINNQPTKYAHFATFPEKLVERCMLAGAPEKVCSSCGKPWERIMEKGLTAHDGDTQTLYPKGSTANRMSLLRQAARERGEEYSNQSRCVGWKPTCACNADSVRSIIFDPFSGSGTCGKVARNLGHKFVGMDLNFTYLHDICPKRMQEPKKKQV
jgi:site-specific DNA-methyltransferase (cytosine-N4-specific)